MIVKIKKKLQILIAYPSLFDFEQKKFTLKLRIFIIRAVGHITGEAIRNVSKHFLFSRISFAYCTISTSSFLNDQFKHSTVLGGRVLLRV